MSRWTGPGRITANLAGQQRLAELQAKARKVLGALERQVRLGNVWQGYRRVQLEEGVEVVAHVDATYSDTPLVRASIAVDPRFFEQETSPQTIEGVFSRTPTTGVLTHYQVALIPAEVFLGFEHYVFDDLHRSLLLSGGAKAKEFARYFPQGIQSGNVDWVGNGRQITWDGPSSRSFGTGQSRRVYEKGFVIATIPSSYGVVNGAALLEDGTLRVIAYGPGKMSLLQLDGSEWTELSSFNLDSNPDEVMFYPSTPSFFRADGLESFTVLLYRDASLRVRHVGLLKLSGSSFSAEYSSVDTRLKNVGFVTGGTPEAGFLSTSIQTFGGDPPPAWAPISSSYPVVVDYDGMTQKRLDTSFTADEGSSMTGSYSTISNNNNSGPWYPIPDGPASVIDRSASGVYQYRFEVASASQFTLNGVPVSGLPRPVGDEGFVITGGASFSASSSGAYTRITNPASNVDPISGSSSGSGSITAEHVVDVSDTPNLALFFYCDVRKGQYGYVSVAAPSALIGESYTYAASTTWSAATTADSTTLPNASGDVSNMVTSQSSVETNSTRKFDDKRRGVFGPLSDVADFPGAPVGTDNNSSTFSVSNIRSGASDFRGAVPRDNFGGSYLPSSAGYFEGPPGGFVAGVRTGFANVSAGATPYNFLGDDNASRIEHRNGAVLLVSGVSYLGVALVGKSFSGYDITAKTDFPSTYVLGVF